MDLQKKSNRAKWIEKVLDEYFPEPKVPLEHFDPYTLLIAVLLSAQCTDERVNLVTPHLFKLAKTPFEMVKIPLEVIEKIVHPCGLYKTKAKAILGLSKILIQKHQGEVPISFDLLEELPGVGHKTASVVMAQAFHIPAFPVDTHIHRLAKRWKLSSGKSVEKTEEDLKKLFAKKKWTRLHLQIIYFARAFCPARGHRISDCPICSKLLKT